MSEMNNDTDTAKPRNDYVEINSTPIGQSPSTFGEIIYAMERGLEVHKNLINFHVQNGQLVVEISSIEAIQRMQNTEKPRGRPRPDNKIPTQSAFAMSEMNNDTDTH